MTFKKDNVAILSILSFTILFSLLTINFSVHPFEDAAILMRYAVHIAQGGGIVWNLGDPPLDGGTDFLFMCLSALLNAAGLSIEVAVRMLAAASHSATVLLIYYTLRNVQQSGIWIAIVTSIFFAVGTGLYYFAAYFGTSFFALCAGITWYYALQILQNEKQEKHHSIFFSLSCLLLGLARPEGAILALLIMTGIVYGKGYSNTRVIKYFLIFFAGFGLIYFIWRWNYFGYPLPNPFYKKGGGVLYWDSLLNSFVNSFRLTFPFSIPFAVIAFIQLLKLFRFQKFLTAFEMVSRKDFSTLIPISGFLLMWILLSNETNYFMRFQYPILVMVLMSWYPAAKKIFSQFHSTAIPSFNNILGITFVVLFVAYQASSVNRKALIQRDGRYTIAQMLTEYKNEGYTLATTEAGLLPLYSEWRSIDTWGLNDTWITHNGKVTEEYLDRYKPEVIMVLAYYSPIASDYKPIPFTENVKVIKEYAEKNNYQLAGSFGISPFSTHCYYVRRHFKHSNEIAEKIYNAEYYWFTSGEVCMNYANIVLSKD